MLPKIALWSHAKSQGKCTSLVSQDTLFIDLMKKASAHKYFQNTLFIVHWCLWSAYKYFQNTLFIHLMKKSSALVNRVGSRVGYRPRFKASTNKSLNTNPFGNNNASAELRSQSRFLWRVAGPGFCSETGMGNFAPLSSTRFILPLYLAF